MEHASKSHVPKYIFQAAISVAARAVLFATPTFAFAQNEVEGQGSQSFFSNISSLLNIASISVVAIAVIFAGYQLTFRHKRIGEVGAVLVGGLLIGAAAQIARILLPDEVTSTAIVAAQNLMQCV